jgi:hypothetical protein
MANNIVKGLADQAKVSIEKAESAWKKAISIVEEDYGKKEKDFTDKLWKITTTITKKVLGIKESWIKNFLESDSTSKEFFEESSSMIMYHAITGDDVTTQGKITPEQKSELDAVSQKESVEKVEEASIGLGWKKTKTVDPGEIIRYTLPGFGRSISITSIPSAGKFFVKSDKDKLLKPFPSEKEATEFMMSYMKSFKESVEKVNAILSEKKIKYVTKTGDDLSIEKDSRGMITVLLGNKPSKMKTTDSEDPKEINAFLKKHGINVDWENDLKESVEKVDEADKFLLFKKPKIKDIKVGDTVAYADKNGEFTKTGEVTKIKGDIVTIDNRVDHTPDELRVREQVTSADIKVPEPLKKVPKDVEESDDEFTGEGKKSRGDKEFGTGSSKDDKKKKVDEATLNDGVAENILQQLGGNKFVAMTGAKNISKGKDSRGNEYLGFRLPRADKGINYVKITLNGKDLYDVEYGKIRGANYNVVSTSEDLYNDMLVNDFEQTTKLYTSL